LTSIVDARWHTLQVSAKTRWSFVEVVDAQGRVGVGEASLAQREREMFSMFAAQRTALIGRAPTDVDLTPFRSRSATLPEFAVVSALDQSVWDLAGQQRGVSVGEALGGRRRECIAVYANINRGITERTADRFADHARRAVDEGFGAVKIAPFDGVELYGDERASVDAGLLDASLARIAAVREAVGPDVDLMVDCHWRLNRAVAETMIAAVDAYRLHWLECPVPERPELLDVIRLLRNRANERGVRLAGCEEMSLTAGFMPFLRAGTYDVMMPDVKYAGGLREMLDVADALHRHGVSFSPHSPTGPVCHAASLQICAAAAHVERLEMQYRETPVFDTLARPALPEAKNGQIDIPRAAGFGVRLDPPTLSALRVALA
jgi:galactonate dehydratase